MSDKEKETAGIKPSAMPANEATSKEVPPLEQLKEKMEEEKVLELSTREAYFASLNAWVKQANISQNAMALFPYYLFNSYPQIFQNQSISGMGQGFAATQTVGEFARSGVAQQPTVVPPGTNGVGPAGAGFVAGGGIPNRAGGRVNNIFVLSDQIQATIINQNGGYEHIIAPFWKRAVAEVVDVFLLLTLKLMITFAVMSFFDLDLGFEFDKEVLRKTLEEDYAGFLAISTDFLAFSSDLLVLEILTKFIVCFYEAIWTRKCGATPGKMLLGLRIVYMEAMLPLQPPQPPQLGFRPQRMQLKALLYPAETPSFNRSLMRAIAKNVLMTLLFPMCFIMIFFKNNRTAYDIMTKTIVIEDNPNTVLRRQR